MSDNKFDQQKSILNGLDDASVAFDSEKSVKLYNCNGFYVRMFNKSGEKKYMKVSALPHSGWWIPVKTKNTEFSLYDQNGAEKCVIMFPWHRYLANENFEESNQKNLFNVEWVGNLECKITYMKRSYSLWIYSSGFLLLCALFLILTFA